MTRTQVDWLNADRHAVCITLQAGWTWDEFYIAHQHANTLIRENNATFTDLVYYFDHQGSLPKGYYTHLLRLAKTYPAQVGMVLWVGCHPVVLGLVRNIARYHKELAYVYAFVDTLAEAEQVVGP